MSVEGFSFHKEGFDLYDFNPDPNKYEHVKQNIQIIQNENNTIINKDQSIDKNYKDISNNISKFNTERNVILYKNKFYDYSGNHIWRASSLMWWDSSRQRSRGWPSRASISTVSSWQERCSLKR